MNKLLELNAKLDTLRTEIEGFTDETPIETIEAKHQELKRVRAEIVLLEELEEDAKAKVVVSEDGKTYTAMRADMEEPEEQDILATPQYAKAFYRMVRNQALTPDQHQILGTIGSAGVPIPKSFQNKLVIALENNNVMRSLATVIKTETDKDIPFVASRGTAAWTDESTDFNDSDDGFDVITLTAWKLTRIVKVPEEVLEDVTFDLEGYLVQSFAQTFAIPEEAGFVIGDGVKKPTGVMVDAGVGVIAASTLVITADNIIDLYYSLKRVYRKKATWLLNDETVKSVRKLKDSDGNYLWARGFGEEPETLLGRPIETTDAAPTIAADAKIMAFGDMSFYMIGDRSSRRFHRLNELFAAKGQIGFRGYERVDGKLILPEAVKVLKMASE